MARKVHNQGGNTGQKDAGQEEIRWGRFVDPKLEEQFQLARRYSMAAMVWICFVVFTASAIASAIVDYQLLDRSVFWKLAGWRLFTMLLLGLASWYAVSQRALLSYAAFARVISGVIVLILVTNIPISLAYLTEVGRSDRLLQISLFSLIALVCHPGAIRRVFPLALLAIASLMAIDTLGKVSWVDTAQDGLTLLIVVGVGIGGNLVWCVRSREAFLVSVHLATSEAELRKLREAQAQSAFQALERRDAQWAAVVGQTPVVVLTVDRTGVVAFANPRASALGFQVGDTVDTVSGEFDGRWLRTQVESVFEEAHTRSFDLVLGDQLDTSHWTFYAAPVGSQSPTEQVTLVGLDSTEAWRLRFELRRKSRENALGNVVTSISHDFNNLLMVIVGSAELLDFDIPETDPSQPLVESILDAGQRADDLIRRLLKFVRGAPSRPEVHDVNELIQDMSSLLRYVSGMQNRFRFIRAKGELYVRIDKTELEQILVNLCSNAEAAIEGSGDVTVSTCLDSRGRVQITVQDSGCGIAEEVKKHMFEPYFTTRAEYGGSGIGLATVRGLVESAGGEIGVDSVPQRGTEMNIWFSPVAAKDPRDPAPAFPPSSQIAIDLPKVVLVVDENEETRILASSMLERMGCTTHIAAHKQSAIEQARDQERIDLLVTDFRHDLEEALSLEAAVRSHHPELSTVYSTGHIDSLAIFERVEKGKLVLLQKPYTSTQLAKAMVQASSRRPG